MKLNKPRVGDVRVAAVQWGYDRYNISIVKLLKLLSSSSGNKWWNSWIVKTISDINRPTVAGQDKEFEIHANHLRTGKNKKFVIKHAFDIL